MEKYQVLDTLGTGTQGCVYKVKHKESGQMFTLKQVECNDESECNKAFRESLSLEALQHPYVCKYNEFFVSWDEEKSAMHVSIVSDYYPKGNLGSFLDEKREKKETVDEELIKKWLGQTIEALFFCHKRKMFHRDLKPTNIYISSDDNSLAIGDFGVTTVMRDVRTKTRGSVGMLNWMAPEVLERPYDEKSDTWAIGCLALELATCHLYGGPEVKGKLFEIKHNDDTLKELLQQIGETYSEDLVDLIGRMLDRNHGNRPSPRTLRELTYVQKCLAISDSVIVERKRRAMSAGSTLISRMRPVPKGLGITAVVDYLLDNLINEACVKQAMEALSCLTKEVGATMDDNAKRVVAKAIKDYIVESDVQTWGLRIFNNLVVTANSNDLIYNAEIVNLVPVAMREHPEVAAVQESACALLMSFSAQERSSQLIGHLEGVTDVLLAMRQFPNNVAVQTACCNALWSLTVNDDNVRVVTEQRGVYDVINALRVHRKSPQLVEAACAALIAISMQDENLDIINRENVVSVLLEMLKVHRGQARVVKHASMALAAMVEPDEECAYKVLTNLTSGGVEEPGLPYITDAYTAHKDNAEVVQNICVLLMELAEYDEINAEIKHLGLHCSLLYEVHKRFKDNKEIMKPCEQALLKLGAKIRLQQPSAKKRS